MNIIHASHDKVFKASMSNLQVAQDFFQRHLPSNIQNLLDFNSLALQSGTYIDKSLRSSASDVLYKINFLAKAHSAYLYVLAEHQSSVDKLMPLRLWQYIISVWREHLKQNKGHTIPIVIPLVFYNGVKRYDGPRDIRELIDAPQELIDQFLLQPFYLVDVHDIDDEELRRRQWSGLMEFVMKHAYEKEHLKFIQVFLALLKPILEQNSATDFTDAVLKYFVSRANTDDPDKLIKTLETELSGFKEGENMTTIANYLIEKGMQQGMQQGERAFLACLLQDKFSEIPDNYCQKIATANTDFLLKWGRRVLTSQTIEEVFKD